MDFKSSVVLIVCMLFALHSQTVAAWDVFFPETLQDSSDQTLEIENADFESGSEGWNHLNRDSSEYYAAPVGSHYAKSKADGDYIIQQTDIQIQSGKYYTLTVWTRSLAHTKQELEILRQNPPDYPGPNKATAKAELRLSYGDKKIVSTSGKVNPIDLRGAPQAYANDDGGNVLLDQGYRMEFADHVFYQQESAHPLEDIWRYQYDDDYNTDMAVSPIKTSKGFSALYSCYYDEGPEPVSIIQFTPFSGSPPDYDWGSMQRVLEHTGSEQPWVIDPHLYYDQETERLWMSWGGLPMYITELDPQDGQLVEHPDDIEFDSHPPDYHVAAVKWSGDEWTGDNEWAEGPCLYHHGDYWYFMATYGNLSASYTIRMGRGKSPEGPFYDKEGVKMTEYDPADQEYGNSILLGDEGSHLVPGHPHIWKEDEKYYLGYDYREGKEDPSFKDRFGIRRLYWLDGWPTIWKPVTLSFFADDYPEAIGKKLKVSFRNSGEAGSITGFDHVTLKETNQPTATEQGTDAQMDFRLKQNVPNPFRQTTRIEYTLPSPAPVVLKLYDVNGVCVRQVDQGHQSPGTHTITLKSKDLSRGIYFYRLQAGNFVKTRKCMLLKGNSR